MRYEYTPEQVRMLLRRAERQLEQAIAVSEKEGAGTHVARVAQVAVHDTVVSLTRLFREHVPGAAEVATRIARTYAKGADARAGAPLLACVRAIAELAREGREKYMPDSVDVVPAQTGGGGSPHTELSGDAQHGAPPAGGRRAFT